MNQKAIVSYLNGELNVEEDVFVDVTLYRLPGGVVREFCLKVANKYPGGISAAIEDLMRQAVKKP